MPWAAHHLPREYNSTVLEVLDGEGDPVTAREALDECVWRRGACDSVSERDTVSDCDALTECVALRADSLRLISDCEGESVRDGDTE